MKIKMMRLLALIQIVVISSNQVASAGLCTKQEVTQPTGEKKCVSYRQVYNHHWGNYDQECSSYENVITTLYTYISCRNFHLTEHEKLVVSTNQGSNCKYIVFEDSNIPTIQAGTFASYTEIKELYLNSSKVRNLELAAFGGMSKLELLHLEDNDINEIVRGTLNSLTNLKKLDLSKNNLSKIEDNSFQGLLALEELNLTRNSLNDLTASTLGSLGNLKYIDISFNRLSRIDEKAFSNTYNLEKTLINNNDLEDIPWSVMQNLTNVKVMDFSWNKIKEIDFNFLPNSLDEINVSHNNISLVKNWLKLNNIKIVKLNNNNISEISAVGKIAYLYLNNNNLNSLNSLLFNCSSESLKEIHLFNNKIKLIDVDSFKGLTNLEKLMLHDNRIEQLPIGCFADLSSLISLDLSHNNLIDLEFGTFTGLSNLEQLDLSYNKLIGLHENSFYVLSNLKILYLHNNNIKSIINRNLLFHLTNLKFITLKNNNWTCNSLLDVIKGFRDRRVNISEGDNFKVSNVQGIPCLNEKQLIKEKSSALPEDVKVIPFNTTETLKHVTVKDGTFCNTTFYKFLEQDFKDSTFYTFFNKEFLGYIERDLNKSKLFQLLDQYPYNNESDNCDNSNNALESAFIFKYFDQDFHKSGFFEFFNEGYKDTQFYKELIAIKQINDTSRVDMPKDSNAMGLISSENLEIYLRTFGDKILILQFTLLVAIIIIIIMFVYLLYQLRLIRWKSEQNKKAMEASLELL